MRTGTRRLAALLSGLALLSGCSTVNPYTGESQTAKATIGAGLGAAAGAVAGVISGRHKGGHEKLKRAVIGAAAGAAAGGAVGAYLDVQEAKLRERLKQTGVGVVRNGDAIVLTMPGHITFASGDSNIRTGFHPILDSVALVLNEYDQTQVDILGHTDNTGDAEYNQMLSELRAIAVAQYLTGQGVNAERLITNGFGETNPVAANASEQGRRLNRRVEIKILSPPAQT